MNLRYNFSTIARLKPGVPREQMPAELNNIQKRISDQLTGQEKMELKASVELLR